MILVNFKGYGEWFIRDGNSAKLAIVRRTNNPFEDPQEWKPPKPYGPYSEEYPYPEDDNEESFYDRQFSFPDRDREYDRDLRGIFMRDPDIRGKIYDTNGLRCFGADYMICGKYPEFGFYPFRGVFRLSDEDEEDFRLAGFDPKSDDWDKFKGRIKTLKPCRHPSSLFSKMVNEGALNADIENEVFFEIQKKLHIHFYEAPTLECVAYELDFVDMVSDDQTPNVSHNKSKMHRRIESLKAFINWLEKQANNNGINEFDRENLDCTKDQLFEHLKLWEESRIKKNAYRVWNVKNWGSCDGFWGTKERKDICNLVDRRGKKTDSAYKKIIY